jgi:transposase-like protein
MSELLNDSSALIQLGRKRQSYTGFFKAKVVHELINGKKSLRELSEQYNIHPNQIKNWKSLLLKKASNVLDDKRRKRSANIRIRKVPPVMAFK